MPKLMLDIGTPERKKLRVTRKTVIKLTGGEATSTSQTKKNNQWVEEVKKKEN